MHVLLACSTGAWYVRVYIAIYRIAGNVRWVFVIFVTESPKK